MPAHFLSVGQSEVEPAAFKSSCYDQTSGEGKNSDQIYFELCFFNFFRREENLNSDDFKVLKHLYFFVFLYSQRFWSAELIYKVLLLTLSISGRRKWTNRSFNLIDQYVDNDHSL